MGMHLRSRFLAAITVVCLVGCVTARAQSKTAPASAQAPKPAITHKEDAEIYRNATFGFHYQWRYGWVDRTKEMQSADETSKGNGKGNVLLAVFERPPEATGDSVNSAVVIASESAASYAGLKTEEDYVSPLTELATANGFKADGEAYPLEVGSRRLVRADFSKQLSNHSAGDKLIMRQCTLILLAKGQIVSFTFIGGSEDEIENLVEGLGFSNAKSPPH